MLNKVTLTKDFRKVAKSIIKNTQTNFYRPDLTKGTHTAATHAREPPPLVGLCLQPAHADRGRPAVLSLAAVLAKWSLISQSQKKKAAKK